MSSTLFRPTALFMSQLASRRIDLLDVRPFEARSGLSFQHCILKKFDVTVLPNLIVTKENFKIIDCQLTYSTAKSSINCPLLDLFIVPSVSTLTDRIDILRLHCKELF